MQGAEGGGCETWGGVFRNTRPRRHRSGGTRQDAQGVGHGDGFAPIVDTQFLIDVGRVAFGGTVRDDEALGDFFGTEPLGQQLKNLLLAIGQRLDQGCRW